MTMPTIDLGYPTPVRGKIPSFRSIEEEAVFWDTHELTDYMDDADRVAITVGGELGERVTVRLDRADRVTLARYARQKGVGPSTLVRMWLKERLNAEAERAKNRKVS
jgi:hypothetical protein